MRRRTRAATAASILTGEPADIIADARRRAHAARGSQTSSARPGRLFEAKGRFMLRLKQAWLLLPLSALLAVTAAGQGAGRAGKKVPAADAAAFFESVEKGDAAAVRRLLASGVSANAAAPERRGEPALLRAVRAGHAEVVEVLLKAGADPSVTTGDDRSSPLSVAVACGRPRVVGLLLEHKADVNYGDADGHSNLMVAVMGAALSALPPEAVEFVSAGMEELGQSVRKEVPRAERLEVLRLLVGAGADLNLRAADCGLTALVSASMYGDAEVARLLLEAGADPNAGAGRFNPLSLATLTLEELLEQAGRDAPDERERRSATAFYEATARGRAETARLLRRAGAREPGAETETQGKAPDAP